MKTQKVMKWALPALLMSAMTFQLMPGSVKYYAKELVTTPETEGYNFFTVEAENIAASCLPIAGLVTFVTMILALVSVCVKKHPMYKAVSWCSLLAGALAAIPYMAVSENEFIQPNVIIILIMMVCWILAMVLSNRQNQPEKDEYQGRRL